MTYERREEILSKDSLTIEELGELLGGMNYQTAAKVMRNIKRKSDRLGILGRIHTEDYLDAFGIERSPRYSKTLEDAQNVS